MPIPEQHRRDASAARLATTPLEGEIFGDTTTRVQFMGDGGTPGGIQFEANPPTAIAATTYTVLAADVGKLLIFTGTVCAVALAQAGSSTNTFFAARNGAWFLNLGSGNAVITPATSTINGVAAVTLAPGEGGRLWSDGANYWMVIGRASGGSSTLAGLSDVNFTSLANNDFMA